MTSWLDEVIEGYYPGSKTPRQPKPPVTVDSPPPGWDSSPETHTVRGKEMEFFGVGALAQALNRSIISIRVWERKGYIPKAPYRAPDHKGGRGKRLYTRKLIEATVEEFDRLGLLYEGRVEWMGKHQDLTARLVQRWTQVVENEKYT